MSESTKKDELVSRLHRQIDEASGKIDELRLKTHLAKAEAKTALEERIESLENRRNRLRDEVRHLQQSSGSA